MHGVSRVFDFTSQVFKIVWWIVPYNFKIIPLNKSKKEFIEHFFNWGLQYNILSLAGNQKKCSKVVKN